MAKPLCACPFKYVVCLGLACCIIYRVGVTVCEASNCRGVERRRGCSQQGLVLMLVRCFTKLWEDIVGVATLGTKQAPLFCRNMLV
jgi:hypothetical protein